MPSLPNVLATLLILAPASFALAEGAADADPAKGQQVYTTYCTICHGDTGDGQGAAGKSLNPPPRDFTKGDFKFGGADKDIFDVITHGAAPKGGSPLMNAWGPIIPEPDRWALVAFIRSLKK